MRISFILMPPPVPLAAALFRDYTDVFFGSLDGALTDADVFCVGVDVAGGQRLDQQAGQI